MAGVGVDDVFIIPVAGWGGKGGWFRVVTKRDERGNTKAHMEEDGYKRLCIWWLSLAKLLHCHEVVLTL